MADARLRKMPAFILKFSARTLSSRRKHSVTCKQEADILFRKIFSAKTSQCFR
ncbi:hypothetical protein LINPERPRIM_LOCUS38859, partial [Linum perenne]